MLKKKGSVAVAIVAVALLTGAGIVTDLAAAVAPSKAGTAVGQSPDLLIYNPAGTQLLGRSHYTVTQHDSVVTIEGRSEFLDGEHDIERDTLKAADGELPRMLTYEHSFFDAHGAAQIVAKANTVTGRTSCTKYENGKESIETAVLEFPPDTYAGAGVLVPIAYQLRRGSTEVDVRVFDCALGPRILTLRTDLTRAPWSFRPHDGELAMADAHPVFGWFNIFLKPFVPTIRLWFDPMRDFTFVGGILARYYRGPEVLLVSMAPPLKPQPAFERPEPPVLTAPHYSATPPQPSTAAGAATPSSAATSAPEHIDTAPAATPVAR